MGVKIEFNASWNQEDELGRSNHESDRSMAMVKSLVKAVMKLPGIPKLSPGFNFNKPPGMHNRIYGFYQVCCSNETIEIVKGIHQRNESPHITVRIKEPGSQNMRSFHVDLQEFSSGGLHLNGFKWRTVAITYITHDSHREASWPCHGVPDHQSDLRKDQHRLSMDPDDFKKLLKPPGS